MVDRVCFIKKGEIMARSFLFLVLMIFIGLILSFAQQEIQPLQVNDYRIGPKDLLEITVFGLPELNQTVRVSEDGSITMSILGRVEVSGLTAQELEKKLASILDKQYTKEEYEALRFMAFKQKTSVAGIVRELIYERLEEEEDIRDGMKALKEKGNTINWETFKKEYLGL